MGSVRGFEQHAFPEVLLACLLFQLKRPLEVLGLHVLMGGSVRGGTGRSFDRYCRLPAHFEPK